MESVIPVHYHQLPLITGTDIVYEEALPLWDMNAKRIIVGDGVTPGGVRIPNFNDDLSYVRKFVLADTTAVTKDWLICTTQLTVNLPEDATAMSVVRISTLADVEPVTVKTGDTVVLTLGSSTTVELVYGDTGWVVTENTSAAADMGEYLKREALMLNGAAAQLVSFKSMTQSAYDLITPVIDAVYFIRDTGKLIFNGVVYGSGGGGGGESGVSTYLYVAYAADDTGAGFSLIPTDDLPYRAEIHVHVEIQNPTLSDFADAVWIKYIATGGGGGEGGAPRQAFTKDDVTVEATGDDQNAAYLTLSSMFTVVGILDNEGVQWNLPSQSVKKLDNSTRVDISSVLADKGITADKIVDIWYVLFAASESGGGTGGSVAWSDVTGKPSTYPPAAHTHTISQVDGLQTALDNAGKVKTVNGISPDDTGNITIETGGTVKTVNGISPDESGNVIIDTGSDVDENRLLPTSANHEDMLIFDATSTVGGGNDESTKFLIQIPAGGSLITDTAAGNQAAVPIEDNGVQVNAEGEMVFSGSNYLKIAANTLPADLMGTDMEFTIDILYTAESKSIQCLFGRGDSPRMDFLLRSSGVMEIGGGPNLGSGWPFNTQTLLTFDLWKLDNTWNYAVYRNGSVVTTGTWGTANFRGSDLWIGWEGNTSGREMTGKIKAFRLTNKALYKGVSFSPNYPWSVPVNVGEWGTVNKSEFVTKDSNRLLPATDTVPSANVNNPVIFKAISRIDKTYWLCLPLNEDTLDRSNYEVLTTVEGTAPIVSNAPSTPGGSIYFNGSSCLHGELPAAFGVGDFTVRMWMMAPSMTSSTYPRTLFSTRNGNATSGSTFALHCQPDGNLFIYSNTDITPRDTAPLKLQAGVWYHLAVVRKNGVITIYVDGQTYASGNMTNGLTRQVFSIGASWGYSSYNEAGTVYISSLDVLNYAAYDGEFTTPTYQPGILAGAGYEVATDDEVKSMLSVAGIDESRLLPDPAAVSASLAGHPVVFDVQELGGTGDANTLLLMHFDDDTVDYSPNAHSATKTGDVSFQTGKFGKCLKFASASGGSYLQIPSSTAFNLANRSAWTFDVWVYISQTPGYTAILAQRQASSPCSYQFCFSSGTRKPQLYTGSAYVATGEVPLNTWTHVAFTYLNGTLKIWIGGQLDSTFTNVSLTDYDLPIEIGYHYSSTDEQFIGLLDELRLSSCDRTADPTDPMYSADGTSFTPPAKPYGVTSNRFKVSDDVLVSSVNDVKPDAKGNITLDATDIVEESRLLPTLDSVPVDRSGNPVVFDYQSGIDADTLCLLHLDDASWTDATGKNTVTQNGSVAKVSANGYFDNALDLSANLNSGSLSWLTIPWLAEYENSTWTMEFFAKPTKAVVNFMFFSFGNSQGSYLSLGSQSLTNLWLGNGSGTYTGSINMQLNTWYWFVVQYDGAAVKVYVDGTLIVQGNFEPNYIGQDLQFGNLNLVNNQDNTFIGYLDEFRWSKGLRYPTGVMTRPEEPFGTPTKSYKVSEADLVFSDSTRLLPETPDNGAIPCFNSTPPEGVNYNDSHTVMLVQGSTTNMALGTKLPFMVTGTVSAQEDGSLLFPSGSDKLVTTSAAEVKRVFGGEFTVDVYMKPTQFNNTSRQDTNFFYLTGPSTYYIYGSNYNDSGSAVQDRWGVWAYAGQRVITLPNAEYHHAALDVYLVSGSRKYTIYYDGVPVLTGDWYTDGLATAEETTDAVITFFGTSGEASLTNAYVKALRVSDIARYKGVQFTPPAHGTYGNPPAGYWDTINKSEFKATRVRILSRDPSTRLAVVQPLRLRNGVWETDPDAPEKTVKY
jgi:hypothetical protein